MHSVNFLTRSLFLLNLGIFQTFLIFLVCHGYTATAEPKADKVSYWYSHDYPNPRTEPDRCGRSPDHPSWLCDPDNFLSEADEAKLDELISSVHSQTRCKCYECITNSHGYLIMVALMEAMYRDQTQLNGTTPDQKLFIDTKTFASDLMLRWGKESGCQEYVFILFSRNDHVLYTLTQKHAKELLNNTMIDKVNRNVFRYFSYKEGVAKGLEKMITYYKDIFLRNFKDPSPMQPFIHNRVQYSEIQESQASSGYKFSSLFNTFSKLSLCSFLLTYLDISFI